MKKVLLSLALLALVLPVIGQEISQPEFDGQSCTSIMVGKRASKDGSVITSHTCDGRYRTWMYMEPAADHEPGTVHPVYKGTLHTTFRGDTTGVRLAGAIPEAAHTYAYLNTAYPCLNEHQLAIGESTFGGPDTLRNPAGMFLIEELERVALQRCTTARDAIRLIAGLIKVYGYGDSGECITIADTKEVWQMEILGEGKDKIGGIWAAQRIPDDHVGVSCNIPRIGRLQRGNSEYFMCSDNIEAVARRYNLWDGKEDLVFWKVFNSSYANGKNFREREYFILNALAPSMELSMDMDELPFSIRPDRNVDVRKVMELLRSTYEGTDMDMCQNVKMPVSHKGSDGKEVVDTLISPIANPWLSSSMQKTLNTIAPGTIQFRRTVSVAWCSYSFVAQMRDWLPDCVGGLCWMSVDNPGQSPRIPIFSGNSELPQPFSICGQKEYNPDAIIWKYRRANKLATVAWQRTKGSMMKELKSLEDAAFVRLETIEREAARFDRLGRIDDVRTTLNGFTRDQYENTSFAWSKLEAKYWSLFGMGF